MEIVAQHLQRTAISLSSPVERDLFGRSAFNRYYYAMFLEVKACLATLRPEWSGELAHAAIPELLRGKIKKELTRGRNDARRIEDYSVVSLCGRALSAAQSLATLMDEGRAARVTADYQPDILVDFSGGNEFCLNTISVKIAQTWPHKARGLLETISSAWMQLHA